jgi:hypothetical protein
MNKLILLLVSFQFLSCSKNSNPPSSIPSLPNNELIAIQVDFKTQAIEGYHIYNGIELTAVADSLPIGVEYNSPGDFGDVLLYWQSVSQRLFEGTIVWMGLGQRQFPAVLGNPNDLIFKTSAASMPDSSDIQWVLDENGSLQGTGVSYTEISNAIDHLSIIHNRRADLPMAVYFYTPSVGMGDPATWKYWVIIPQLPVLSTQN